MNSTILKYESESKIYEIRSECVPHHDVVGGLKISEHFQKREKLKKISSALGDYYIVILTEVYNSSEIQSKHFEIEAIISEIDRSWMYACGHSLNKK